MRLYVFLDKNWKFWSLLSEFWVQWIMIIIMHLRHSVFLNKIMMTWTCSSNKWTFTLHDITTTHNKHINTQHDDTPIEMPSDAFNHNNSHLQIPTLFISLFIFSNFSSHFSVEFIQLQKVTSMPSYLCCNHFSNSLAPDHKLCSFSMISYSAWSMRLSWTCSMSWDLSGMDSCNVSIHPSSSLFITNHECRRALSRDFIGNLKYLILDGADDSWEYGQYPGNAALLLPLENRLEAVGDADSDDWKPWCRN